MNKTKSPMTRRSFISAAAAGMVGTGLAGMVPGARAGEKSGRKAGEDRIIERALGKTGLKMPIVGMGVMNANNPEVVRASWDIGVRHFDTAAAYQKGNNERMVGKVIRELGVRDRAIVGTKIYTPSSRRGDTHEDTRRKMLAQIDESLERLQMEYVDILYVHNLEGRDLVENEAVLETLEKIKKSGKARFTGVTTHRNMTEVVEAATDSKFFDVVLTVINFKLADDEKLLRAIDRAAAAGVGVIAMKTQAGGRHVPLPSGVEDYSSSVVNTASLKWVLRKESITAAIPGYTTFEHMKEDFSVAYGLEYDENERCLLDQCEVDVGYGYCNQCDLCRADCPAGADVATLMRIHMYAAQYSNFDRARHTLDELPEGAGLDACRGCGECTVRCHRSVDVARRIDELRLIYA